MPITRTQKLFGVAIPAAVSLLALGMVTGACALKGTATGRGDVSAKAPALAQLAAAYTKHLDRSVTRSSRTFAAVGSVPFFGALTNSPADTPLDQLLGEGDRPLLNNGLCPPDMASIDDRYCVDRYEATVIELLPNGEERPFSSFEPLEGHVLRAVSEPDVYPRGYISAVQAEDACARSGKRLCKAAEWRNACMGPKHVTYGYSTANEPGRCNDHGRSPMGVLYGGENLGERDRWDWERMNSPALNQVEGTLARSGEHTGCTNDYGVYDMVGNLHEWVAEATFNGGYYLDTQINGEGCTYRTSAHAATYHDYSTGFRCCSDVAQ
jgi:sulfatase modifying factor 1